MLRLEVEAYFSSCNKCKIGTLYCIHVKPINEPNINTNEKSILNIHAQSTSEIVSEEILF